MQNISLLRDIVPFITKPSALPRVTELFTGHESLNYSLVNGLVSSYAATVITRVRLSTRVTSTVRLRYVTRADMRHGLTALNSQ